MNYYILKYNKHLMSHKSIIQNINKFCKTLDTTYLENISDPTVKKLFITNSKKALKIKKAKKHVASKVLQFYGVKDQKKRTQWKRYKTEIALSKFTLTCTGAREGDTVIGIRPCSKGAIIKVVRGQIYPQKRELDNFRAFPDLWESYLLKLQSIEFFANMSRPRLERWLEINQDPYESALGENGEAMLEVTTPGTSDFVKKLDESILSKIIGHELSGFQIMELFPKKAGSRAKKHTLILLKSMWKLNITHELVSHTTALTINLMTGEVNKGVTQQVIVVNDVMNMKQLGFTGIEGSRLSSDAGDKLIISLTKSNQKDLSIVRNWCKNFSPASYKSLIQKCIRYPAKKVTYLNKSVPTPVVLCTALLDLVKMPGAFVPDIQRYVTGVESATKRLAVSIVEDSSVDNYDDVLALLSASLLANRVRTWVPTMHLCRNWLIIALKAYISKNHYVYQQRNELPTLKFGNGKTSEHNASAIMNELRSFPTDLGMFRWIGTKGVAISSVNYQRPKVLRFEQCVDQHWAPNVAYYFDPDYVKMFPPKINSKPFAPLFGHIWNVSSSCNPRKGTYINEEKTEQIYLAQKRFLYAKQTPLYAHPVSKDHLTFEFTLDDGWLASMVGPIEVPGKPVVLVTMKPNDPYQLIPFRRPSREMKNTELSPERYEQAIEQAKSILKNGVRLNKATSMIPFFRGKVLKLLGDVYVIDGIEWNDSRNILINVPIVEYRNGFENVFTSTPGIVENFEKKFTNLLKTIDSSVLRRSLMYLSTKSSLITLNPIGRDGGGTKQAVSLLDADVNDFLIKLSSLIPAAIHPHQYTPGSYKIPYGPILWTIKDRINKMCVKPIVEEKWNRIEDKRNRTLWSHQVQALKDMIDNHELHRRGNFLWLRVGSGKTAITMYYLKYLLEQGSLPPHVIYTLPSSAISSVADEIQSFGFRVELVVPVKKQIRTKLKVIRDCKVSPYTVTLIEHDYLRRCKAELTEIAPNSIFIIDEVHKALNETQRTAVALELSHLSREFIALTGTPVVDSKTYKLIWWLEQVVPFEVNEQNFWTAANAMVTKVFSTGIEIEQNDIVCNFTEKERKMYYELVPPTLGGTKINARTEDFAKATAICYKACEREMVKLTVKNMDNGVMLVAKNGKHAQILLDKLLDTRKIHRSEIFVIEKGNSIFLTDDEVEKGKVHDYKVVIVPMQKAEGYTLTRLGVKITSVYPSNNATREQLDGRINRIGQKRDVIYFYTVHCGLLTRILMHHKDAKNLQTALREIAKSR